MIALWSLAPAFAFSALHPWCAPVELPGGVARIEVPPELRSVDDPADGSDLVLLDLDGMEVPFARIEGDPGARETEAVTVIPTEDPHRFGVDLGPRPVDLLRVTPPDGVVAAEVTVVQEGVVLAGPALVWRLPSASQLDVALPGGSGRIELVIAPVGTTSFGVPRVEGVRRRGPAAGPERIEVPVGPGVPQENGWTRFTIVLPRPLPVDRFTLQATPDVFSRRAAIEPLPVADLPSGGLGDEGWPDNPQPIERIAIGGVRVESATVRGPWLGAERYELLVSADRLEPLEVTGVVAEVDRVELLVLDAPAGPATLCGGAPPGTRHESELAVATPELVRAAEAAVRPGPVAPNPDWVPPEVQANLVGPGPALEEGRFRWRRQVEGAGLVRVPLPPETLSALRPDLGDLRLVADGHQVPFVLRRLPVDPLVAGVTTRRWEQGATSWLEVVLPARGLPLARIVLRSPAAVFDRQVTVYRPDGGRREVLRVVRWVGRDRPSLVIEIPGPIDDRLLVAIDNGADPPLPLDERIEVAAAGWELLATVPPGGAELVYGAPAVAAPDYDLVLLERELARRASEEATLGPVVEARAARLSALDRVLLAGGIGVLALGLGGLLIEVLRRLPKGSVPAREPA